ncbi:AI-2E family transporter [Alsobacter sp. R-9]
MLAVALVAALWAGQEIFVPIALAILLSFVLAPAVRWLQGWRMPRAAAVPLVVLFAFAVILVIGGIVALQLRELAANLPLYQTTIREKAITARDTVAGTGALGRAAEMLENLGRELKQPASEPGPAATPAAPPAAAPAPPAASSPPPSPPADIPPAKPLPVEVHPPEAGPFQALSDIVSPILHPLATAGLIVIFVVFILLQREDLRNRLIRLAGSHDIQRTTAAIDDAAHRLSRLYLAQLGLNAAFGSVIALGCWLIGLPSPLLWGILAAVLRFVPYVGAVIAALFPLALAVAVDPGWSMVGWTLALFALGEPLVGHVIEPLLFGRSTGLSPVAVVMSAAFWTWLWGPVGLVLATPLTVCLVVLGRHVERLQFLDVMFGSTPALSPPEVFYQRMLARDPIEAADQAEDFLAEGHPVAAYYDGVAIPGLLLAQADLARGALDDTRVVCIREAVGDLVADLHDPDPDQAKAEEDQPAPSPPAVLCLGGRHAIDEAAAVMVGDALSQAGIAGVRAGGLAAGRRPERPGPAALAVVCYLDTSAAGHVRYAIRRLRRQLPDVPVVLVAFDATEGAAERLREALGLDAVTVSVAATVEAVTRAVAPDRAEEVTADAALTQVETPPLAMPVSASAG